MTDPTGIDGEQEPNRRWTWREREAASRGRGKLLNPELEPSGGPDVYETLYVGDELLIDAKDAPPDALIEAIGAAADVFGWVVTPAPLEELVDGGTEEEGQREPRSSGAARSSRVRISAAEDVPRGLPAQKPDAWLVLRELRRRGTASDVSLNHVLTTDSIGVNPFKANPFKANPFKANPFKANPFKANAPGVGIDSYAFPGFGGRQPVTYVGAAPARTPGAYSPVVAIFDTGCGTHPWLDDARIEAPGGPLGIIDDASDPERYPALGAPLDGIFDDAAGHGTFIAGVVRQACPDARILPVRIADGQGLILENELIGALGRFVDMLTSGAQKVDVLNLSFSYYHESPERAFIEGELYPLLKAIRATGCVVVCSAGNDATDRPSFPAALYDWTDPDTGAGVGINESAEAATLARHLAVGALNPSNRSVALFSNVGPWVTVNAPGVSVLSTIPVSWDGGIQAGTSSEAHGRRRETLDIDDFRGGFALWSGTSFAAPLVAGRIAARLAGTASERERPEAAATQADPVETAGVAADTVVKQLREADRSRLA